MDFSGAHLRLDGDRIYARTLEVADATERYASWLNDPEVNRFLATKGATVGELREYIAKKITRPDALYFGIFLNENDLHIGTVKLEPIDLIGKKATIAIMIGDKSYWGRGLAGEAMTLLIRYCFDTLGIEEMHLGVVAKNIAAIRSYEKLGFREVKRDLASVTYGDEIHDQVWMTLTRSLRA